MNYGHCSKLVKKRLLGSGQFSYNSLNHLEGNATASPIRYSNDLPNFSCTSLANSYFQIPFLLSRIFTHH